MSYILDALKKSERQRPPGPVPDLFTVQGPQPAAPPRPRWLGVAAGLAAAGLIAGWAWFGADRREDAGEVHAPTGVVPPSPPALEQLASPPVALPAPPGEAPLRETPRRQTTESAKPAASPRQPAAPTSATGAVRTSPAAQVAPQVEPAPVASSTSEAAAPSLATPASPIPQPAAPPAGAALPPAAPVTPPAPAPEAAASPVAPVPLPAPKALPAAAPAAPEEAPPADGRVLEASELPASIRAGLPQLSISGHVWSEEPALRLLTVDDRVLREGAEAAPGVRLQEITEEGAVFVFKGWRYRVGGFRP